MSAFEQIKKIVDRGGLDVRVISPTELQVWSLGDVWPDPDDNDKDIEYPGALQATFYFDRSLALTSVFIPFDGQANTAIGQLAECLKPLADSAYYGSWQDLKELKLEYRKVGNMVEVDIVSYCLNWWNYEKDGVKYQALFCDEFHEGPDIRTVEATLLYDPATDRLQAR